MQVFHQMGHNFVWNIDSIESDGAGDGLIISPVNIKEEKLRQRVSTGLLSRSWFDPQFYRPQDNKGGLETYPFFPSNVITEYSTTDYAAQAHSVAKECLKYQHDLGLRYLVIPTRYSETVSSKDLDDISSLYVEPFLSAYEELGYQEPLLLTVIVKESQLSSEADRDELLSWSTGYAEIAGIYLIFENGFKTKQIVEPDYLVSAMRFIYALRQNELQVHVGYSGLEGLLYAVADATSVSIASYENLRSFSINRLDSAEVGRQQQPRARVYSGKLNQWIVDTTLPPIRELYPEWRQLFEETKYKDFLLDPKSSLNSQRSELYKHYFLVFCSQLEDMPSDVDARVEHLQQRANQSIKLFEEIREAGVLFPADSDDAHLYGWVNALSMFRARPMP